MAVARMTGNWAVASALLARMANPAVLRNAKDKAIRKECNRLRKIMVQSFNAGGPPGGRWKRLSLFTQLVSRAMGKGDRRPLMDYGDLRNSHSVVKEGDVWFVGVHRTAKGKRSKTKMVNIAMVHENGSKPIHIKVTDKMRRFFMWLHQETGGQIKPLKQSTRSIIVRIPPRPWMAPIWAQEADNAARNIIQDTIKELVPGI